MKEVIISVIFNIGVAILLKLFNNKTSNPKIISQVITYNYLFSAFFCFFLFKPNLYSLNYAKAPWFILILMSILMPLVFILIGKSIKYAGIARTDIAQRMSLLLTVLASFVFFREAFNWSKTIGLFIGFISIIFIFSTKKGEHYIPSGKKYLLILIFFGLGIINILYKLIAANEELNFTTSTLFIFLGSFFVGSIFSFMQKIKFSFYALFWGIGISFFNFGNVLFYLKAHQTLKDNPSIVFATMNLGVIILGSLVGVLIFKEKMNRLNYFGLLLALIAIVIITLFTY